MNMALKCFMRKNYFSKIIHIQISEETRKGKHTEMEAPENSILAIKKTQPTNQTQKSCRNTLEKAENVPFLSD